MCTQMKKRIEFEESEKISMKFSLHQPVLGPKLFHQLKTSNCQIYLEKLHSLLSIPNVLFSSSSVEGKWQTRKEEDIIQIITQYNNLSLLFYVDKNALNLDSTWTIRGASAFPKTFYLVGNVQYN